MILKKKIHVRSLYSRRALVVAAILLALFFSWRSLHNLNEYYNNLIEIKQSQYSNLVGIIQNRDRHVKLQKELESYVQSLDSSNIISASSLSLVEVKFQNIVQQIAQQNNLNIRAIKNLDHGEFNDYKILQLVINSKAEIGAINDFLFHIYDDPHFLYFTDVTIKRINRSEERFYIFDAKIAAVCSYEE